MSKRSSDYQTTYDTEIVNTVPQVPRQICSPRAQRQALQIVENASLALGYERCRTALYQNTLEGLGVLSLTAGQLSKLTPQAEEHYWKIVESYANQARKYLERW